MSFMPKHYAAMREYMELKPEINAGVSADPANSGYVVVPGMDTVLCKLVNHHHTLESRELFCHS
jgi:hypothetical protein